jgi:cell division protein ZapA (FtsZ GTPase activity inhibitor)
MDELEKLQSKLKRYRALRDLTTDEPALAAIEEMIREAEDRLAQIESGPAM